MIELLADGITTRIKDVVEYHPQAEAWMNSIGRFSVGSLRGINESYIIMTLVYS